MPKKILGLVFGTIIFFLFTFELEAAPCGNGVCQPSQSEDCNSCAADCGTCPTPPPTPTPPPNTPTPTPVTPPTPQPTTTTVPNEGGSQTQAPSSESSTSSSVSTSQPSTPTPTPPPPSVNPPTIPEGPTDTQTPVISGSLPTSVQINRVDVSFNNGESWFRADLKGNKYSYTPEPLEDGNYSVRVRVLDVFGRFTISDPKVLIIDTLPPMIGGASFSLGTLAIQPDTNGGIQMAKDSKTKYVVGTRGGVIKGKVTLGNESFGLSQIKGTDLFSTELSPSKSGSFQIEVNVEDGAGRKATRKMNNVIVNTSGEIRDRITKSPLSDAKITVFYFESDTNSWTIWDGATFGQENPKKTDTEGLYSFMLPSGKYYVDIDKKGYKKSRSEIFSVSGTKLINFDFSLKPLRKINLILISFNLPSFLPPDSFNVKVGESQETGQYANLIDKDLPDIKIAKNQNADISSFKREPIVISFVSSWSNLSLDQISKLQQLHQENSSVNVLSVFLQEAGSGTTSLVQRGNYSFDYIVDRNGYSAEDFKIFSLPQTYIVDKNWIIKGVYYGVVDKESIIGALNALN